MSEQEIDMHKRDEQVNYTVRLDGVTERMTNRWSQEFLPDRVDVYWIKDQADNWVLEVINVAGIGVVKRTGELGKRRHNEWFYADTASKLPALMRYLVNRERPGGALGI